MLTDSEIMAQVLAAFREEQAEHRQAAGELLLELERVPNHPQRQELLDQLFREAHSLKGGARAASQTEIEQIAHRVEDLFSAVRQGRRQLTPEVCDPVYAALDAIGALMNQVSAGQPVDLTPYQPLLATLEKILDDPTPQPAPAAEQQNMPLGEAKRPRAVTRTKQQPAEGRAQRSKSAKQTNGQRPAVAQENGHSSSAAKLNAPRNGQAAAGSSADAGEPSRDTASSTVRLSTTVLDSLLNEAGELMTC